MAKCTARNRVIGIAEILRSRFNKRLSNVLEVVMAEIFMPLFLMIIYILMAKQLWHVVVGIAIVKNRLLRDCILHWFMF